MTFTQPYFWSRVRNGVRERWSAVLVTPAITIVSSSVANPTVLTTLTPHGLATGDTVTVAGHTGSTPAVSGELVATVLTPLTLSVPVDVSVAGSGGAVTRTAAAPVLTLADAKLHARMDPVATAEDVPAANWTRAATRQVELETGIKILPQTYDVAGDAFPPGTDPIELPFGPLLAVSHIKSTDAAGALNTMTAADYLVDTTSLPGRIGLADAANWPTDLRDFQPVSLRVIVGHASIGLVDERLLQAVRLALAWHSMSREPSEIELASFNWLIDPLRTVKVA